MSKYSQEDASKDTDSSKSETTAAWHQARDDAVESGHLTRGGGSGGNTEKFSRDDSSGQAASGFWDSIFGSKK